MSQDLEQQVKNLKRFLEGWRMALLPLKSILLWEQHWHPCAIITFVSLLYMFIWLMDLNFLATISMLGLLLNFLDFIIPFMSNSICSPGSWTGQKEKTFEDICKSLVFQYTKIIQNISNFYSLRENSPCMYYIISISMSCTLAWMASSINNLFLLYILSIAILLWPGIKHRGIINTLLSLVNMAPKVSQCKTE